MLNNKENIRSLFSKIGSINDYLPRTVDEAREDLISRAKETVIALREGEVKPGHRAPMAWQQKKTKLFCVKIGYGGNNAYMPNPVHKGNQVLKYETAVEAADDIENIIIPAAEAGAFDDGLNTVLKRHKKLAEKRWAAKMADERGVPLERSENAPEGSPAVAAE